MSLENAVKMKLVDLKLNTPPCSDPILFRNSDDKVLAALMIEQVQFIHGNILISGWIIGDSTLTLSQKTGNASFRIQRNSRLDVAKKYSMNEYQGSEFGFTLSDKANIDDLFELTWLFPKIENLNTLRFSIKTNEFEINQHKPDSDHILLTTKKNLKFCTETLPKLTDNLLIIGSAPSIEHYLTKIQKFQGERWALNDSWFWLEKHGITVDKVFITDTRFIKKSVKRIESSSCPTIVTTHTVDLSSIEHLEKNIYVFRALGRDGFSLKYGEVYHGCSVFFTAIQTAFSQKYQNIAVCGVSFPPPGSYFRIDGSSHMPEYVHNIQLNNAHHALKKLRDFDINLEVFEPESNLNFL